MDSEATKAVPRPTNFERVHTPTLLQMQAVECGAAALGIILSYHGRWVPLSVLRADCDISRDGSKASNIVKAGRLYGLESKGYKKKTESLFEMKLPLIVFWNFNHFLVVEGFDKKWVYINDPKSGPRKVTYEEFDRSYTGVVLTFQPGPEFEKRGHKPSVLRSLKTRLAGAEKGLAFVAIATFLLLIPGMIAPAYIKIFVDEIMQQGRHHWFLTLVACMLGTILVHGILVFLKQYFLLRLQMYLALSSSTRFMWHVLRLPMDFFNQRFAGDVSNRVQLNDKVASLLSGRLGSAAVSVLTVAFYLPVMLFYDLTLTLIVVVLAVVNIVAVIVLGRVRKDANALLQQDEGKLVGTTLSGLRMIETLKATGRESDFFTKWAGYQAKIVSANQRLGRTSQALSVLPSTAQGLAHAAIVCVGGLRIMEGQMTLGGLLAFQTLMGHFLTPVTQLVSLASELQTVEADLNRLDDILQNPVSHKPSMELAEDPRKLSGKLELKNVTFGYSRLSPPLIEDFDLTLEPGQRVALVGSTGSGKSTIAKLVCGLYEPWSGEIEFDGTGRNEIPAEVMASSLALVDQNIVLFSGTLRDNLTLWNDTVGDAELRRATTDAGIYEAIAERGGFEQDVAEAGGNFSGGERQRIEIARALSGNPTVLVMDEATSALDPIVEMKIDQAVRSRGCTCLIVAHRLSTIRDCDEIIVLKNGRVAQRGTHDELNKVSGLYQKLVASESVSGAVA